MANIEGTQTYGAEIELMIYSGRNIRNVFCDNMTISDAEVFFDKFADGVAYELKKKYGGETESSIDSIEADLDGFHGLDDEDCYISCTVVVSGKFGLSGTYYPATLECQSEYNGNEISEDVLNEDIKKFCETVLEEMTGISSKSGIIEPSVYVSCEYETHESYSRETERDDF